MTRSARALAAAALAAGACAAAPAAAGARAYSPLDAYLLRSSIQGDRFEIAGGKLAQSNAANATVKALGARLVKDHTKSLKEAARLARRLGIAVPKTPSTTQEWELQTVGAMSGAAFDASYARLEVQDHKEDIENSKTEVRDGANASARKLARDDLPVLRAHLQLSQHALRVVTGG
jgi:putative membrane protein